MNQPRLSLRIGLVVSAWLWFVLVPFLLERQVGVLDYLTGFAGAFVLWVPMALCSVVSFVGPRPAGVAVSSVTLAIPLLMLFTYGSFFGLLVAPSGMALLGANLLREKQVHLGPPPPAPLPPLRPS